MRTHASIPVADRLNEEVLRIYFGTRDARGLSHIGYVDVEADNPVKVIAVSEEPVLPLGELGTFDDRGIMPSWILRHGERKFFYYIGWNPQVSVSYRLSIGLAISDDGGRTFTKYSDGPVCDRSIEEPFFNTAPCVRLDGGTWRMWYISCTGWEVIDDRPEPRYHVKYADSIDGIHWRKTGRVCLDYDHFAAAIGRPCVYKDNQTFRMFYSYRSTRDYRSDPSQSYRLGYAESDDGLTWMRKDAEVGIQRSDSGWDSQMIEYCSVYEHKGRKFMLYNGNGFGKSGFGYAELERE
ncbi:MAG TPA: hypothetical protein VF345_07445 [Chthoniobacterales bacterium]